MGGSTVHILSISDVATLLPQGILRYIELLHVPPRCIPIINLADHLYLQIVTQFESPFVKFNVRNSSMAFGIPVIIILV